MQSQQNPKEILEQLEQSLKYIDFIVSALSETSFYGTEAKAQKVYFAHKYLTDLKLAQEEAIKHYKGLVKK
jgi:hypothetical protein